MNNFEVTGCLLCGDLRLYPVISLGETPLANEFVPEPIPQDKFPLNLVQCQECKHVQLDFCVSEERMYRNYLYATGGSASNLAHFEAYADELISEGIGQHVLEIASNDGSFLHFLAARGKTVLGVDPAKNLASLAEAKGVPTIEEFFNRKTARAIGQGFGNNLSCIVANNVMAHNADLSKIMDGVMEILATDGIFVFENSYLLDVVQKNLLDLVYHEHIHQLSLTAVSSFLRVYGMTIYKVKRLPNHGGSIRFYACCEGQREIDRSVEQVLSEEKFLYQYLDHWQERIDTLKTAINEQLNHFANNGDKIAIYGFPAKATTLLYALNIDPEIISYAVDDAPLKQGTFSPGKHIPISSPTRLVEEPPNVILILAWNFAEAIIAANPNFKGTWMIPLPELSLR